MKFCTDNSHVFDNWNLDAAQLNVVQYSFSCELEITQDWHTTVSRSGVVATATSNTELTVINHTSSSSSSSSMKSYSRYQIVSSNHQHLVIKQGNIYSNFCRLNWPAINYYLILNKIIVIITPRIDKIIFTGQGRCPSEIIEWHSYIIIFSWPVEKTILNHTTQ